MMKKIYLDHAASTSLREKALHVLSKAYREDYANPGAVHSLGKNLLERIEQCRSFFLETLQAGNEDQFIFTSSATESNNILLQGLIQNLTPNEKVLISSADHPSLTLPVQRPRGAKVDEAAQNPLVLEIPLQENGHIHYPQLAASLSQKPHFIALSHVNNHTGTCHPLENLCSFIKEIHPAIHIHVDAVQSFGKLPISVKNRKIDSITFSAHKMGGPKGVAGLYLASHVKIPPLFFGGGQEAGLRSSTLNAPLIFSWSSATEESLQEAASDFQHLTNLVKHLKEDLKARLPQLEFPFDSEFGVSPYILTFLLPHLSSDIILRHLEEKNIFISSSSACSSRQKGTSPVFTALHLPKHLHKNVLRVSLSGQTTLEEILNFSETLTQIVHDLLPLTERNYRR